MREKFAKLKKFILRNAHEDNVWHWLGGSTSVIFIVWGKGLEYNIGLEVRQNLVVSEVGELWQVKDWLFFLVLVIFVVENFNQTLSDEVHFLHIALVGDDNFARRVDSAVHSNDQLISEASLAFFEEVVEGSFEFLKDSSVLDEVSLHFWGDLLIELELFNNQVEIVEEGLLYILSDIIVQGWLNMERLVGFFNLLDPHVK